MKRTVTSILKKSLNAELAVEYFFFSECCVGAFAQGKDLSTSSTTACLRVGVFPQCCDQPIFRSTTVATSPPHPSLRLSICAAPIFLENPCQLSHASLTLFLGGAVAAR